MSASLVYWIVMLIWLLLGLWSSWPLTSATSKPKAGNLVLFLLLVLLGWKVFGPPIHG